MIATKYGFETYDQFLRSKMWKDIKKKHYAKPQNQFCYICGSMENLRVHHKRYRKIDKDLITLCENHHNKLHLVAEGNKYLKRAFKYLVDVWHDTHGCFFTE